MVREDKTIEERQPDGEIYVRIMGFHLHHYSTMTMVICLIYSMSKWISTYSELWPSIGIPPIAASLLGR
ncbi:hypothetical protein Gotri_000152 [Gossypium trilobum]|uniref:Uncharacterized protein n=1 Tax=Gossypium trilobum TaxID=34281 RepID=A0A7J9FQ94_9ROSI|nr:hypothetical protein [Gossypium trilobum]